MTTLSNLVKGGWVEKGFEYLHYNLYITIKNFAFVVLELKLSWWKGI